MKKLPDRPKRVSASYRLHDWIPRAVQIEAAHRGIRAHILVEGILSRGLSAQAREQAQSFLTTS